MNKTLTQEFKLVAGHIALDFANTLDYRYEERRRIDLLTTYDSFLDFAVQGGAISVAARRTLLKRTPTRLATHGLKKIVEVREALYHLFLSVVSGKPPKASWLRTCNSFLGDFSISEVIAWRESGLVRISRTPTETPLDPLWRIAREGAVLLTSPDRAHIRECCDPSCRWLFLDTSKNQSRRWCSMLLCGGRNKARRYYARETGLTQRNDSRSSDLLEC
jgi:predicted RNA-binding Zn ribbon-like protein